MSESSIVIASETELSRVALMLLHHASDSKIYCLYGDLGAGKTSLVNAVARSLGSVDLTSSPSYSIINEYKLSDGKIYHMDLYRLNRVEELMDIGLEDYLYSGEYIFIEWPEIAQPLLPPHHRVKIEVLDNCARNIVFLWK